MLDRRDLLKIGASSAALAATGVAPISSAEDTQAKVTSRQKPFELEEWTLAQMQEAMESQQHSAQSLTKLYLRRIEQLDVDTAHQQGLRSVIETNPQALEIAEALDAERMQKGPRGPLHGIPILIKDNIDTADQMETSAGSLALLGTPPTEDAFLVSKLRQAGAVLLGKTNLSEWANFRSERSSSGWSGRGGQTRNPYVLDRNPCGSSSGSGAAASANLCGASIGTETNGSIMCPANANGLVGIKPSLGLISRSGIVPIAQSQDTAGPMARCVTDAATLLGAMVGEDPMDAVTKKATSGYTDYRPFLKTDLRGKRIGVWRESFGFHEAVDQQLELALLALEDAGATMIDPIDIPQIEKIGGSQYKVLLYEFKAGLNAYLEKRQHPMRSLEHLISFNRAHAEQEMPYFQQEIFEKAQAKGGLEEAEYLAALANCKNLSRTEGLDRVIAKHSLDAIVAPTGGPAWVTDWVNGDHFGGGSSSAAAVSGYASVTVPAGAVHGLPIGLSFIGGAFSEPTLLHIAYGFEQTTKARISPNFLRSL